MASLKKLRIEPVYSYGLGLSKASAKYFVPPTDYQILKNCKQTKKYFNSIADAISQDAAKVKRLGDLTIYADRESLSYLKSAAQELRIKAEHHAQSRDDIRKASGITQLVVALGTCSVAVAGGVVGWHQMGEWVGNATDSIINNYPIFDSFNSTNRCRYSCCRDSINHSYWRACWNNRD